MSGVSEGFFYDASGKQLTEAEAREMPSYEVFYESGTDQSEKSKLMCEAGPARATSREELLSRAGLNSASSIDKVKAALEDRGLISEVVSPDAEVVTNEKGGSQSHIPVRFDLVDAKALFATAAVLHEGAEKYAPGNWRNIPVRDHLNHLLMHVYAYLSGDTSDDHLSHAVCRAIFALGVDLDPDAKPEQDQT